MIYRAICDSPVGRILLCANDDALTRLCIEGQPGFCDDFAPETGNPVILQAKDWLKRYFDRQKPSSDEIKISLEGTAFRLAVWELLLQIPYGKTITYGSLAAIIAERRGTSRMSAQAVGGAVGSNPISIIVPCHRVMGRGGNLTGYAGGTDKKIKLLELEGIDTSQYYLRKSRLP